MEDKKSKQPTNSQTPQKKESVKKSSTSVSKNKTAAQKKQQEPVKKNSTSAAKKRAVKQKKQDRLKLKQEKKQLLAQKKAETAKKRAETERLNAVKRMEAAKLKQERKQLKEKAKSAKKAAAQRKARLVKEKRELEKQKKIERKKLIKSENTQQRKTRLAKEKAEKQREREQKIAYKKKLKEEKKHAAMLKAEANRKGKKDSTSIGGWLAAVIALGVSTLVLGSLLAITYKENMSSSKSLTGSYQKSFYDLVGYVDNMDNNLAKFRVTDSSFQRQKLLTNVLVQSELAESNISQLPINDESKFETVGFINSVGDYSRAMINKLAAGGTLTQAEEENFAKIYAAMANLKSELSELADKASKGYNFKSLKSGAKKDIIIGKFGELENHSVEYPKLIYDGPFSAALEEREAKALKGLEEVTKEQATDKFKEYFKDYKLSSVTLSGEVNARSIQAYNINAKLEDGAMLYAQLSKSGGKLIMFTMQGNCNTQNFDTDTCVDIAKEFLEATGHSNMRAVWINDNANIANINFAFVKDDVIVYSDLIKVKVCEEKGKVIGFEANSYYLNHTEDRQVTKKLSLQEAKSKVTSKIDIETSRLTIIPTSGGSETLAYEFMGQYEGATYYVYIDALTGFEAEVFRVVKTTEGTLLM